MLNWFKKKAVSQSALLTYEERKANFPDENPLWREVDTAFHTYLEVVTAHPKWNDGDIEQEMVRRGIPISNTEDCVVFGPLAWGRELVAAGGVT
ncbi:MAG: hypothetical protein ACRCZF_21030, partial [Gemmataceae bacterium]